MIGLNDHANIYMVKLPTQQINRSTLRLLQIKIARIIHMCKLKRYKLVLARECAIPIPTTSTAIKTGTKDDRWKE